MSEARIEGNNTTIVEYIETKLTEPASVPSGIKEIQNIEKVQMRGHGTPLPPRPTSA